MSKLIDLTGKRFGKLTVIKKDKPHYTTGGNIVNKWMCQCDCGNQKSVLGASLRSGNTRSCGCLGKEKLKDLTGRKFNRLTVIKRAENYYCENSGMAVQWLCKCDCGKDVIKKSANLLNGKSKSCGCLRNEIGNNLFQFEVGQEIGTKYGSFLIKDKTREERKHSRIRDKKYICKCLNCGEESIILEHTLTSGIGSCRACSDSRSFGERFFYWLLKQFDIDFDTEYSPVWAGKRKYDFHFYKNGKNYIVEIDGAQHINRYKYIGLSYEKVVKIDIEKENMAKANKHKVIRINCKDSKGKFIAENIKKSELSNLFDLDVVDWKKCFYMSMSSKARKVCGLWNDGYSSTKEISEVMEIDQNYASKLLTECAEFGLCDYDSMKERDKGRKQILKNSKKIICTDNGNVFQGAEECSRRSKEIFGVYLNGGSVTRVCRKERKAYKGFHFEFVE